ncbi:MAG: DUF1800 family protein, partial [Saprospiraceae bacterium]|nr:DUF1800 family protein [Saprospiraceae bacterium]
DYDMARVMHYIFTSPFFYDQENQANKIKAPIDLMVQTARLFGMKFHDVWAPTFLQRALGQVMFDPPNVAGWPGGRAWINNSTLMLRLNLAEYLIDNQRFDHAVATPYEAMTANSTVQNIRIQKNMVPIIEIFSGTTFNSLGEKLQSSLLAGSHNLKLMTKKERHSLNYTQRAILRLTSLPEFQMC